MTQPASESSAVPLNISSEHSGVAKSDQPDSAHPVLNDELMARVAIYGKESEFEAGEEVSSQGNGLADFLVILKGELLVFDVDNHGSRREISRIHERQFTGELTLLAGKPTLVGMVCL